jgi:hypothetical protein
MRGRATELADTHQRRLEDQAVDITDRFINGAKAGF